MVGRENNTTASATADDPRSPTARIQRTLSLRCPPASELGTCMNSLSLAVLGVK
jgi:hypothetical protein